MDIIDELIDIKVKLNKPMCIGDEYIIVSTDNSYKDTIVNKIVIVRSMEDKNNKNGINDNDNNICTPEDRILCDKVNKDKCVFFSTTDDTDRIWSCHCKVERILD